MADKQKNSQHFRVRGARKKWYVAPIVERIKMFIRVNAVLKGHRLGASMEYDVAVDIKIFLEDHTKLEHIKSAISKIAKVQKFWEEEIAFGAKALKAVILMSDKEGGLETLEEKIKTISGVSEVQVENITRI